MNRRAPLLLVALLLMVSFVQAGGDHGFNSPIHIEDGALVERDLSALNGGIRIGDGATIRGEAGSVNGSIRIGRDVRIDRVHAVNGGIEIGDGTVVDRGVSSVNGRIELDGVSVGEVSTVNGRIEMDRTSVDGDVETYHGDITLRTGSRVSGDIVVREPNRSSGHHDTLRITIENGSVVEGDIIVEDRDLEVEVVLRGGSVQGRVEGARVIEE